MLQIEQDEARGTVTIAGRVYAQDVFLQLAHWLPIGQPFVIVKRQEDGVLVVRRLEHGGADAQHPPGWDAYVDALQLQVDRHLATPAACAAMRTAGKALAIAAFEAGADAMHDAAAEAVAGARGVEVRRLEQYQEAERIRAMIRDSGAPLAEAPRAALGVAPLDLIATTAPAAGETPCQLCGGTGRYGDGANDGSGRWIECPNGPHGVGVVDHQTKRADAP